MYVYIHVYMYTYMQWFPTKESNLEKFATNKIGNMIILAYFFEKIFKLGNSTSKAWKTPVEKTGQTA